MKKRSNSSAPEKAQSPSFPVVVIGASAGGIQAVTRLFKNVSPTTGMAFVYVQHLEPTHQSMLPEILARATSMKIHQPRRIMQMAPNHVYVCPPDKDMIIQNGYIKLVNRPAGHAIHLPIDKLFLSAAGNSKSRGVIGILLSGNSSDGAAGMKAIKSAGGVTFAQDETAQFDVMPKSAVSAGAVDISLPPEAIAAELDRLSSNINEIKDMPGEAETSNIIPPGADLDEIFQIISSAVGVDFSLYKKTTIRRRIARRMLLLKQPTLKEYITYLKEHADEVTALYRDVLINVTSFFRDTDTMQYLKRKILPRLLKNRKAGETVRVWVPGCSSGEEAYSIAILFMEVLGEKASNTGIQLFATDLSETAISRARAGVYTPMQLEGVSPERIQRFFTKADGNYRIAKFIRDLCIFSIHNVFKDPPFSRIDLVSCSNLFIYLESLLQKKILTAFHYALNDGGFLVLGKSETIGPSKNLFAPLDKKIKVFTRKKDITSRLLPEMNLHQLSAWKDYHSAELKKGSRGEADYEKMLERLANEKLLQKYVPASVVVNQDLEILQFRGSTGLFLEPSPGKASLNLLKMARPGLGFELKKAVHKVIKTGEHYKKDDLEIKSGNKTCIVNIEVEPLIKDSNE
ncbi:MAG TPA: CheR family methyltransferase, partial [Chitinophagaceae bacterium]|nr:CheR family methyltransferase [Chitinophagaceae bacterium]